MKVIVDKLANASRPSPWFVRYHKDRKRIMRFFATREEAENYAKELRNYVKQGTSIDQVTTALQLVAGTTFDLAEVVKVGLKTMQRNVAAGGSPIAKFRDVTEKFLEGAIRRGCRNKTIVTYRSVFSILNKTFGDRIATCISDAEVDEYIRNYPDVHGNLGAATYKTRETYLRHLRMILRAAGISKPLQSVELGAGSEREIRYFSVEDVKTMFAAVPSEERGMLALALLAGLRPERLGELPKENVCVEDQTIRLPAWYQKCRFPAFLETVSGSGGDRENRPGPPPILWTWLKRYPFEPCHWQNIQKRIKRALGGRWIQDGCRHTAATYFCAKFGVLATAELLTHSGSDLVKKHYAGICTRAQADLFFSITPDDVDPPPVFVNPRAKIRITPDEMRLLMGAKTMLAIGREFGCSSTTVAAFCRRHGIPTPGRGHAITQITSKPDEGNGIS